MDKLKKFDFGDLYGGIAATLVALPSAIAFGLIIYSPLGSEFASKGVIAGILGAVVLGLIAAIFSGTPKLISAPCAPAAAVLSAFAADMLAKGNTPDTIPGYILVVAAGAGILQFLFGLSRGGAFIKFIPYPVIAGYLGGVGCLIILGQIPKFFGIGSVKSLSAFFTQISSFRWETVLIGTVSILIMVNAQKITKSFPAPIMALLTGILTYFMISIFYPELRSLENNKLVIGTINTSLTDVSRGVISNISSLRELEFSKIAGLIVPILTMGVLLSADSLKTCVLLDVLTGHRHNSNQELIAQGLGNISSAICGGVPGGGTTGPTLVNLYSGGKTQVSSLISAFSTPIL